MSRDLFVGVLFLAALLTLLGVSILVRGIPSGDSAYRLGAVFDNVNGLSEGAAVRVRGLEVGRVDDLSYDDSGVRVEMIFWEPIEPRTGYAFTVKSSSALGGRVVIYEPGSGPLADPSALAGQSQTDGLESLGNLLDENSERLTNFMTNADEIMQAIRDADGALGRLIMKNELGDQVDRIVERIEDIANNVSAVAERSANQNNLLNRLINDPNMADQFDQLVTNLTEFSQRIRNPDSAVGFLTSNDSRDTVERFFRLIDDTITNYEGDQNILSLLLRDPDARDQLANLIENLSEGPGVFHTLSSDKDFDESFRRIIDQLDSATYQLSGPYGTVGRLLHSDELYDEVLKVLRLASDGFEDFREQQPINTVIGAIFQALSI